MKRKDRGVEVAKSSARLWAGLAVLVMAASACGGPPPEWQTQEQESDAGARVVVNTPPKDEPEPEVLVEELRIGKAAAEDPERFGAIKGLVVLSDNRIAVLDALAQEVRIFAADGRLERALGGKGEGAGQLSGAYGLMLGKNDELWVPDHNLKRMSVFDADSGFLRAYDFPILRYGYMWDGTMLEDGRIVVPSVWNEGERQPMLRVYSPTMQEVKRISLPTAAKVDPLNPPGAYYFETVDGEKGYMTVPFYPEVEPVLDAEGTYWSSKSGDPTYLVRRWNVEDGKTLLYIKTERKLLGVKPRERDSVINTITRTVGRFTDTLPDFTKIPRHKPAVNRLFVSLDKQLWVQTATPDSLWRYDVYDMQGKYQRSVATSLHLWPHLAPVVRGDSVWTVVTDKQGVEYVVRARIEKPKPKKKLLSRAP